SHAPARPDLSHLAMPRPRPAAPFFPYTTLFRSIGTATPDHKLHVEGNNTAVVAAVENLSSSADRFPQMRIVNHVGSTTGHPMLRSEEHTSELQSREKLVCRLLLETKSVPAGACI